MTGNIQEKVLNEIMLKHRKTGNVQENDLNKIAINSTCKKFDLKIYLYKYSKPYIYIYILRKAKYKEAREINCISIQMLFV